MAGLNGNFGLSSSNSNQAESPLSPGKNPTAQELQNLFERQRQVRWTIAATTAAERNAKLKRLAEAIKSHRESLYGAVYGDYGKHPHETELTEIFATLEEIAFTRKRLPNWMKPKRVHTPLSSFGGSSHIHYEPKGMVLIFAPWNYPFHLAIMPLIAAVAAGNCVILRPSDKAPRTARLLLDMLSNVFPAEEVAVVLGDHHVADRLLDFPFDHIFFTGSPAIGRKIMAAASKHLASVTLELGGKSPVVFDETADIKTAAERVAWAKFINAGQTCVAPDYVLVHETQAEKLAEAFKEYTARSYGAGNEEMLASDSFACLVNSSSLTRLDSAVRGTIEAGARLVAGGAMDPQRRRFAPTILINVPNDSPIMQEEIFGPVLPLVSFRTIDEAVEIIRARSKPLAMYIFSRDKNHIDRLLASTSAGGTTINNILMHLSNPNLPFGGIGESGMGHYHGQYGFEAFSHARAVYQQRMPALNKIFFPPYGKRTGIAIRVLNFLTR